MATLHNPFITIGYAGPDLFCDREEETKSNDFIKYSDFQRNKPMPGYGVKSSN